MLGLRKGNVVTLICRNRIESIDLYLACGKLGIVLAPLSQRLKKPELDDFMTRQQPAVLIHENQLSGADRKDPIAGRLDLYRRPRPAG